MSTLTATDWTNLRMCRQRIQEFENIKADYQSMKEASQIAGQVMSIIEDLAFTSQHRDAGKYGAAFWFLRLVDPDRDITLDNLKTIYDLRTLLPTEVEIPVESDWLQGYGRHNAIHHKDTPEFMRQLDMSQVAHLPCDCCGNPAPLVLRYHQEEDGPDGDTWSKKYWTICTQCPAISEPFAAQYSDDRF